MAKKKELAAKWEEVKDKIQAVQKGVAFLKQSGINEKVLYWLIQKNSERFRNNRYGNPLKIGDVKAIIRGIETFEDYVFPPTEKENS